MKEFHFKQSKPVIAVKTAEKLRQDAAIRKIEYVLEEYLKLADQKDILLKIQTAGLYIGGEWLNEYLGAIQMILDHHERHPDPMVALAQTIWDYYHWWSAGQKGPCPV